MKNRPKVGAEWLLRKSGPGASNHFEAGGFIRSNDEVAYPNLMYHFLPIAVRYDGTLPEGGGGHGYQVHVGPMYSDVRGTCKVVSRDPRKHPALRFNYSRPRTTAARGLGIPQTRGSSTLGLRAVSRRRAAPGKGRETSRSSSVCQDARRAASPCTDRMGTDGIALPIALPAGERIDGCGWSTPGFPMTNGNIYAPVMMTAEKSADLILGNTPLPAENVEFYRHDASAAAEPVRTAPSM